MTADVPEINRIRLASNYLDTLLRRRPDYAAWLWDRKQLYRRYPLTDLYQDLQDQLRAADCLADLARIFREFKQRHFLRIGGRDLLGLGSLEETTSQLSDLAGVALQAGLDLLRRRPHWWLTDNQSALWQAHSPDCRLVVMGFGKLGGNELNYVSDVDICVFRQGLESRAPASASLIPLISRLAQQLRRLLADPVDGDRVFQVDFRLRPGGKEGELVPALEAATEHYLNRGSSWERQMLLKARPVAGDRTLGTALLHELRPFIFRRFLDFQAIDELRAMRDRILVEAGSINPMQGFDVKLGQGGIREIEFMVQAFQLIYGGRRPQLDEPNTLRCLTQLQQAELLPPEVVTELGAAYTFLRRIEHWNQLDQNRQTQKLPKSAQARQRLAVALGYDGDYAALEGQLERVCSLVHEHFSALFRSSSASGTDASAEAEAAEPGAAETGNRAAEELNDIWSRPVCSALAAALSRFPQAVRTAVARTLAELFTSGRKVPEDLVTNRLHHYFQQASRRSGLMRLFASPGPWLDDLCRGIARSALVASLLTQQPNLVEGPASSRELQAGSWEQFADRLLASHQDFEEALEWIRRLKNERLLMVALADLDGRLGQPQVERTLTDLARFVVRKTYERMLDQQQLPADLPLAILALGKLGSGEFNYLSDLDLMFVYDPLPGEAPDQIPQPVVRLIQRLNHMLSIPLQEGPGYAVDTRLRPTGNYGPLVATRGSWEEYYSGTADLWEIQALLRMQPVAGRRELCARLTASAHAIRSRPRAPDEVWPRLCHLRRRMEEERSGDRAGWIDLKLGRGGVVDLEFLVQGLQLCAGVERPPAAPVSVRDALPEALAAIAITGGEAVVVTAAFDALRALEHRLHLHLNLSTSKLNEDQFEALLDLGLWPPAEAGTVFSWDQLKAARRRIRGVWEKVCRRWDDR